MEKTKMTKTTSNAEKPHSKVQIIFFAYMLKSWDVFIEIATNLRNSQAYDAADSIYIAATIRDEDVEKFTVLLQSLLPKAQIYAHDEENDFEYKGLKCLHETAAENTISLYIHTKGAFFDMIAQILIRRVMYASLFRNANECIKLIQQGFDKVCAYKSKDGICWYNLFWISGKFLLTREAPIHESENRYYYKLYLRVKPKRIKSLVMTKCVTGNIASIDVARFEHGTPQPMMLKHIPLEYRVKTLKIKVKKWLKRN